jgi:hypothetical protein
MTSGIRVKGQQPKEPRGRGRKVTHPRSFWVEQCQAYEASGLRPKQFCAAQGLAYSTFYQWFNRLSKQGKRPLDSFIQVEIEGLRPERMQKEEGSPEILERAPEIATGSEDISAAPQTQSCTELKLTFGQGLILVIPKGFDPSTLRQVVEALA